MITETQQTSIVNLYKKGQLSMVQIARRLDVSPTTVQFYLQKRGIKRRSISEAVTIINENFFQKKAFRAKKNLTNKERDLKIGGIMLYWGEGAKTQGSVQFTNSDPEMIKTFLRFLRIVCGIDEQRLKPLVHYYPDHDLEALLSFWSHATQIPRERFYRSHLHEGRSGTYKTKSSYGTLALNYADKRLLKLILVWIDEYKEEHL